jgi:hypothetical protein
MPSVILINVVAPQFYLIFRHMSTIPPSWPSMYLINFIKYKLLKNKLKHLYIKITFVHQNYNCTSKLQLYIKITIVNQNYNCTSKLQLYIKITIVNQNYNCTSKLQLYIKMTIGWGGFSPKHLFTKAAFHRTSFSLKGRLFIFRTVHRIYQEYIEHSKTGLRSSLAALEAEI